MITNARLVGRKEAKPPVRAPAPCVNFVLISQLKAQLVLDYQRRVTRERGQKVNPDCDDHRLSLKTQSELPASGGVALQ
ncbi:hypothetical protein T4B_2584 [Trichinella pseudospiralis]|uniref:Uncharacterized protein n=2 Tax=Trichinella pseudospiralis TaxID=6337 RepID=A0A0V1F093_TRIPS|nr:hypothetical protein T4A_10265 [Trichinella pseudospiralis]KRY88120.1 hypothetical protein T4D_7408 [Trichinella pseudospiralis]KRZ33097.1 hypothetical protein T4B_2584 [Trichinella pseudospiralis]KRZ39595.1 hypothetical protein T4C_7741 [Trichinella pseudospiralis]